MAEEGATKVGFCNVAFRIASLIRWQPPPPHHHLYQQCIVFIEVKETIKDIISGYSFLDLGLENIEEKLDKFYENTWEFTSYSTENSIE